MNGLSIHASDGHSVVVQRSARSWRSALPRDDAGICSADSARFALLPPRYTRGYDFGVVFGLYVLAKIFETADRQIFSLDRHTTSGHTLKHLAAGAAGVWVLRMLKKRPPHTM